MWPLTSDVLSRVLGEGHVLGVNDGTVRLVVPTGLASVGMDTRGVLAGETGNVDKLDIYTFTV